MSLLAAGIFLAHPLQTEAVTYIIQRLASLATFWYLIAIWSWLKHKPWLTLIGGILAVFTKEIGVTLPLMLIWLEFWRQGKIKRRSWLIVGGVSLLILGLFLVKAVPLHYIFTPKISSTNESINWQSYILTETRVLVTYVRLLVLPVRQNLDYYYPLSKSVLDWRVMGSLILLCSLGYGGYRLRHIAPLVTLGMGWFLIALLVESSVMPIADVIFEHRLYLPMVGVAIAMASGLYIILSKRPGDARMVGILLVVCLMGFTYRRNLVWRSEYSLWQDVVAKSPQVGRGHNLLGVQ